MRRQSAIGITLSLACGLVLWPSQLKAVETKPSSSAITFCMQAEADANEGKALAELAKLLSRYQLRSCRQTDCCPSKRLVLQFKTCGSASCLQLSDGGTNSRARRQLKRRLTWKAAAQAPLHSTRQQGQLEALAVIVRSMVIEAQLLATAGPSSEPAPTSAPADTAEVSADAQSAEKEIATKEIATKQIETKQIETKAAQPPGKAKSARKAHTQRRKRASRARSNQRSRSHGDSGSQATPKSEALPNRRAKPLARGRLPTKVDGKANSALRLQSGSLVTLRQPILWSPGLRAGISHNQIFASAYTTLPLEWRFEERQIRYWFNGIQLGWQPELWSTQRLELNARVFVCAEVSTLQRLDIVDSQLHWMFDVGTGLGTQFSYKVFSNVGIGLLTEGFWLPTGRNVKIPGGPTKQINMFGGSVSLFIFWTL